jgi:hypothetical protein
MKIEPTRTEVTPGHQTHRHGDDAERGDLLPVHAQSLAVSPGEAIIPGEVWELTPVNQTRFSRACNRCGSFWVDCCF